MNIKLIQARPPVYVFGTLVFTAGPLGSAGAGEGGSVILVLGATIGGPPQIFFKLNFACLTRNVVDNKRSQIAIMRLSRNVDENKQVNAVLPGMLLINKVVVYFSEFR
jgi:hypothetical protein